MQFRSLFAVLPTSAYSLWSANPEHPSLRFK
jgi:hypothetical protein